jgi:hypothetical protein
MVGAGQHRSGPYRTGDSFLRDEHAAAGGWLTEGTPATATGGADAGQTLRALSGEPSERDRP